MQPKLKRQTKPDQKIIPYTGPPTRRPWRQQARYSVLARILAYKERPATSGAWESRRLVTPLARTQELERDQSSSRHGQPGHMHNQPEPAHDRVWRWYEEKEARGSNGQERRAAPERPRELPGSWEDGERYFNHGVKEQYRREMRDYEREQPSRK